MFPAEFCCHVDINSGQNNLVSNKCGVSSNVGVDVDCSSISTLIRSVGPDTSHKKCTDSNSTLELKKL